MGRPVALTLDPPSMPHICICCKAHTQLRQWFIDTGTEVEWEGMLYICNMCFAEMVRVAPEFMSVESHKEITAMYQKELDAYAVLKGRLATFDEAWHDLTGQTLSSWMDNLIRIKEYERGLQGSVPTGNVDDPGIITDSDEPKPDVGNIDEPQPSIVAGLIFS